MANPPDIPGNTDSEQAWEPGQLLLDDFEVQRLLGKGGMGKVYLVRSRTTGMQFAVKHALIKDDNNRQNFLSELQTWIDLPEHPNIAACRFFRTIGDEIAIFSEYISGGTLADWIRDRRLTTQEQILDVAIQFASGLQALHEHGLIHQDVKPGNVLMTPEGIAKVTDFGLARARLRSGDGQFYSPTDAPKGQSVLVCVGGMTQEYCSPEQAAKRSLSRKTDIWSWGVSVLDMFYGQPSCRYGQAAGESLEAYFQEGTLDQELPRMPVEMTKVLGKCFQPKPEHRWDNMREAAHALLPLYQKISGKTYSRHRSLIPDKGSPVVPTHDRRTREGIQWTDPLVWLREAFQADGRNPSEAETLVTPILSSRRAQAIADLAVYEKAYRMFEQLVTGRRAELAERFAPLCLEKAFVHENAGDLAGAVACNDRAIGLYERLVRDDGRWELTEALATAYLNNGSVISSQGDQASAVKFYDCAIEIGERLLKQGHKEAADGLAKSYMNKAIAFKALGDLHRAVELHDRGTMILEQLVNQDGRWELVDDLAKAYMNQAIAVRGVGDNRSAVSYYDRAIDLYERQSSEEGRWEPANLLAAAYMNKANALFALQDCHSAIEFYDRAIEIRERLVNDEGRRELANDLANVYQNKANAAENLGDLAASIDLYDRAIQIREHLVRQQGQRELLGDLGWVKAARAIALFMEENDAEAAREAHEARLILEAEVARGGRPDLQKILDTLNKVSDAIKRPDHHIDIYASNNPLVFSVSYEDVGSCDIETVFGALNRFLDSRESVIAGRGRVTLSFEGYDNDPRDLYDISEVRSYVSALDQAFPYWFYFADLNNDTVKLLALCLCRVVKVGNGSKPHTEDFQKFLFDHTIALNQFCDTFVLESTIKDAVTREVLEHLVPVYQKS
jgi:serine/threonine protein kinase